MRYVERTLTEGERIIYTTRRHWIVMLGPSLLALLLAAGGIACLSNKDLRIGCPVLVAIAAAVFLAGWLRRAAFEFAVTNKRVIYRKGLVSVATDELFLDKIESVLVTQGLLGRWLNYGSVAVRGTGGSWEPFQDIADPLMLRRRIQEQIEHRASPAMASGSASAPNTKK